MTESFKTSHYVEMMHKLAPEMLTRSSFPPSILVVVEFRYFLFFSFALFVIVVPYVYVGV